MKIIKLDSKLYHERKLDPKTQNHKRNLSLVQIFGKNWINSTQKSYNY